MHRFRIFVLRRTMAFNLFRKSSTEELDSLARLAKPGHAYDDIDGGDNADSNKRRRVRIF